MVTLIKNGRVLDPETKLDAVMDVLVLDNYITKIEENIADELSKYKTIIDKYFFGDVDEEKLKEGAIKGYIEGLDDPYTEYISKEDMKEYLEDTKGNFVGIGIYMVKNTSKDRIEVLSPIKNSPAEKARN